MKVQNTQIIVFVLILAIIGLATYLHCRGKRSKHDSNKEYFLAGGKLPWIFVAGSITLTDLSSGNLVGMNGAQMLLLAWWEIAAVFGLLILAFVFIPIYYKYNCTTVTELLEKRYGERSIRTSISLVFLIGAIFLNLPITLYGGSLFMQSLFGVDIPLLAFAIGFAVIGAAYCIFGGLRAVAVSDTYSGVLVIGMALLLMFTALVAINFDFSGIPAERLTLVGDKDSPIPWPTLLTGMIFIQIYYWSTNQNQTQRAMASENVKEAQKGVVAAGLIRLFMVIPIVIIPGIVSYKLYGDIGDVAYGRLAGDLLPSWLAGAFAAAMFAAILSTFTSILNATAALYVVDIHENYIKKDIRVSRVSAIVSLIFVLIAILMVPFYDNPESSLVDTIQKLFGLMSMPILSTFIVGLLFNNVEARAMILGLIFGITLYGIFVFYKAPFDLHYIHLQFITLISSMLFALGINRMFFNKKAVWDAKRMFGKGLMLNDN